MLELENWAAPTVTHHETAQSIFAIQQRKCVRGRTCWCVWELDGEFLRRNMYKQSPHQIAETLCWLSYSACVPVLTVTCMWVTIMDILWVYGAFAFVSPSHFMWNDNDKGRLVDDSNNAFFCLSQSVSLLSVLMLLTGLAAVSWCCSRKSWMCVCLLAGSCVSRPVCVSMCSGGSIPSPYGQCVNLGWTALCVGQQESKSPSHSHLYSLLFYFWSFYSSIWQNQGCIMDLTSSPRASTASGWGKPKHQGMNKATVLVKHWLFSLPCNKAHSVTFTHLCSSTSHIWSFLSSNLF